MRQEVPQRLERGRVLSGYYGTSHINGMRGLFRVTIPAGIMRILSSGEDTDYGWEHVSVSIEGKKRCPTWEEMSLAKGLFWEDEETVMQLHPRKSQHVNFHPYTLHLWRPMAMAIPEPPSVLVGPKI